MRQIKKTPKRLPYCTYNSVIKCQPISRRKSDSTCYLTGTEASCAHVDVLRSTVNDSFYTLYIRLPGSVGTTMRVGNLNTESNALSANIALCHLGRTSLKSNSVSTPLYRDVFRTFQLYHIQQQIASIFFDFWYFCNLLQSFICLRPIFYASYIKSHIFSRI